MDRRTVDPRAQQTRRLRSLRGVHRRTHPRALVHPRSCDHLEAASAAPCPFHLGEHLGARSLVHVDEVSGEAGHVLVHFAAKSLDLRLDAGPPGERALDHRHNAV